LAGGQVPSEPPLLNNTSLKIMNNLDIIKSTSILKPEDFAFLSSVADELRDTMEKRQVFRTETEMEVSVLNDIKHPTKASKYWQSVREQSVMFENLIAGSFEYRRNEVQIKRLEKKLAEAQDEFGREETQIDLDECLFKKANMEFSAKDRIREIKLWSQIKAELDDGSFDTKDVNSHQLVSYAQRFILQASNAPADMAVAEANNLKGQLISAVKEVEARGLLDEVLKGLPRPIVNKVLLDTGILRLAA
jgi:hypothetical protein